MRPPDVKDLMDRAREMERRHRNCLHLYRPDGESRIRPGTIRSEVCVYCGMRRVVKVVSEDIFSPSIEYPGD